MSNKPYIMMTKSEEEKHLTSLANTFDSRVDDLKAEFKDTSDSAQAQKGQGPRECKMAAIEKLRVELLAPVFGNPSTFDYAHNALTHIRPRYNDFIRNEPEWRDTHRFYEWWVAGWPQYLNSLKEEIGSNTDGRIALVKSLGELKPEDLAEILAVEIAYKFEGDRILGLPLTDNTAGSSTTQQQAQAEDSRSATSDDAVKKDSFGANHESRRKTINEFAGWLFQEFHRRNHDLGFNLKMAQHELEHVLSGPTDENPIRFSLGKAYYANISKVVRSIEGIIGSYAGSISIIVNNEKLDPKSVRNSNKKHGAKFKEGSKVGPRAQLRNGAAAQLIEEIKAITIAR